MAKAIPVEVTKLEGILILIQPIYSVHKSEKVQELAENHTLLPIETYQDISHVP